MSTTTNIEELKPYPVYKDSGVPWFGDVPQHWEARKLRTVLRRVTERNRPDLPLLSVVREKGVILRDTTNTDENRNFIPDDLSNYKVVRAGQFAMNKMKAWQGSYGVSPHEGIVSPAYFVFSLTGVGAGFFHRAIRSRAYVFSFTQASDGVRIGQWDLAEPRMREILFLVPPLPEQTAIVRFLDHADRRIRNYVVAKQNLIKLLKEQKEAIIHKVITQGFDPHVSFKASGLDWVEDVPEHWQVVALKRVIRRLIDCEHKTAPAVDVQTPYRVVRTTAVRNGDLRLDGTYFTSATGYEEWTRRGTPEPGDVIFTREAPAGEACVVPPEESLCLGQRTVLMKLRIKEYDPRFLVHMIYAGPPRVRIQLASQGSTVGHFNMDDIGWMKVLKPPLAEQVAVVEWIAEQTRAQDSAIVRAEAEISLLREYRTRLIADIVSGKLDAREAAAKLPDEAEEEVEELPLADETLDELAEKLDEEGVVA